MIAERLNTTTDAIMLEVARLEAEAETETRPVTRAETETVAEADTLDRYQKVLAFLIIACEVIDKADANRVAGGLKQITQESIGDLRKDLKAEEVSGMAFTIEEQFSDLQPHLIHAELVDRLRELETLTHKAQLKEQKEALTLAEQNSDESATNDALSAITALQQKMATSVIDESFFPSTRSSE